MDKKLVIFDFDGTIADSIQIALDLYNEMAPKLSLPKIDQKMAKQLKGLGPFEIFKKLEIPLLKVPVLVIKGRAELSRVIKHVKPFKGMGDVLYSLKEKYLIGIVTSNSEENVKEFLKENNLDIFDFLYSGSTLFGKDKVLKGLLKDANIHKKDVLYIGDEVRDVQAAKRIGIKVISVGWGFNDKSILSEHNPDALVENVGNLEGTIHKLIS